MTRNFDIPRLARPAILGATLAAVLAGPGAALADVSGPVYKAGNVTCADLNPAWLETKIDKGTSGSSTENGVTLEDVVTDNGTTVAWTASAGIDAVIVKGSNGANVYTYSPEATSGSGLTAPAPHEVSHVSACHDPGSDPQPDPEPDPKPDPQPDSKPDPQPDPQPQPQPQPDPQPQAQPQPQPAPQQFTAASQNAPAAVKKVAVSAAMTGPKSCVKKTFTAAVRGKGIRSVTFYANGKKLRTVKGAGSVRVPVDAGVERVVAKVTFVKNGTRSTQTLRTTGIKCLQRAVSPRFTG